jgi:hypothetical protein
MVVVLDFALVEDGMFHSVAEGTIGLLEHDHDTCLARLFCVGQLALEVAHFQIKEVLLCIACFSIPCPDAEYEQQTGNNNFHGLILSDSLDHPRALVTRAESCLDARDNRWFTAYPTGQLSRIRSRTDDHASLIMMRYCIFMVTAEPVMIAASARKEPSDRVDTPVMP